MTMSVKNDHVISLSLEFESSVRSCVVFKEFFNAAKFNLDVFCHLLASLDAP